MCPPDRVTKPKTQPRASPGADVTAAANRGVAAAIGTALNNTANATPVVAIAQAPVEDMSKKGFALFPDQMAKLGYQMSGDECQAFIRLRLAMITAGGVGLPDDDVEIAEVVDFKNWSKLKPKLIRLGFITCETPGFVRDLSLEESIRLQRKKSAAQSKNSIAGHQKRKAKKQGGAA